MRIGGMERPGSHVLGVGKNKCSSESEGLETCGDATCEVYAGNLLDELEESKYNPLWTMPGYTQVQVSNNMLLNSRQHLNSRISHAWCSDPVHKSEYGSIYHLIVQKITRL